MRCEYCDKKFKTKKNFESHVAKRVCYPRVCAICKKSFNSDYALNRHEGTKDHKKKAKADVPAIINDAAEKMDNMKKEMDDKFETIMTEILKVAQNSGVDTNSIQNIAQKFGVNITNNNTTNITNNITVFNIIIPDDQLRCRGRMLRSGVEVRKKFEDIVYGMLERILSETKLEVYSENDEKDPIVIERKRYAFAGILPELKKIAEIIVNRAIQSSENACERILNDLKDFRESIQESSNPLREIKEDIERPYMKNPEDVMKAFKSSIPIPDERNLAELNAQIEDETIYTDL